MQKNKQEIRWKWAPLSPAYLREQHWPEKPKESKVRNLDYVDMILSPQHPEWPARGSVWRKWLWDHSYVRRADAHKQETTLCMCCMYLTVWLCTCACVQGSQRSTLAVFPPSPSTLLQNLNPLGSASWASQWVSGIYLHLPRVGVTGMCHTQTFVWVLEIWTSALQLVHEALCLNWVMTLELFICL